MNVREFLSISGNGPKAFSGTVNLPPSKSYAHRALFISALCVGTSKIENCSSDSSDDIKATVRCLRAFGVEVAETRDGRSLVVKSSGKVLSPKKPIFAGGSGTTARFAISFAALAENGLTKIEGDTSLSNRPMKELLDALSELGVHCEAENGKLPVVVHGGGIPGGRCKVDGSVSSQFISSLLIACTKARQESVIQVFNQSSVVSEPYIDATLSVLNAYGFQVRLDRSIVVLKFVVKGNQAFSGRSFKVPGDMSSGASLLAAAVACRGKIKLTGVDLTLPQSDSAFLGIASRFGAKTMQSNDSISMDATRLETHSVPLALDLGGSPDLVPIVAALGASLGSEMKIENIAHLKFKESDRLKVIEREFGKLGVPAKAANNSLSIKPSRATIKDGEAVFLDPENDHRILMALTVLGLSGKFGNLMILNPSCVKKSYPNFVQDLQLLLHDKKFLRIVKKKVK